MEKTLESPLDCKEIQPVHPKGDQSFLFFGRTDAEAETSLESTLKLLWKYFLAIWWKEVTHWKRPWCWERLKVGGEGGDRIRWLDGITDPMDMSQSKLWERVKDRDVCMLQSVESQRVGHDWETEQQRGLSTMDGSSWQKINGKKSIYCIPYTYSVVC